MLKCRNFEFRQLQKRYGVALSVDHLYQLGTTSMVFKEEDNDEHIGKTRGSFSTSLPQRATGREGRVNDAVEAGKHDTDLNRCSI